MLHTLFAWHYQVPARTRYGIALTAYIMFWILVLARMYVHSIRWGFAIAPSLLIWVILGVSICYETSVRSSHLDGVLVAADVVVRKGNGDGFAQQFAQPLHEGVEFTVVEQRKEWIHIELPDGQAGWIRLNQIELF